jgi:hypothetical protein
MGYTRRKRKVGKKGRSKKRRSYKKQRYLRGGDSTPPSTPPRRPRNNNPPPLNTENANPNNVSPGAVGNLNAQINAEALRINTDTLNEDTGSPTSVAHSYFRKI